MMGWRPEAKVPKTYQARAEAAATFLLAEASEGELLIAGAVQMKEAGFQQRARGAAGEVGLMQIHPRGMAKILCRDLNVRLSRENVRCGVRILRWARDKCGGPPERWLGLYNGRRRCGRSEYAARVLRIAERGRRALADVPTRVDGTRTVGALAESEDGK